MPNAIILKAWMALTGLFLSLFLVVHVLGNLQLFLPAELAQTSFNAYSKLLVSNPVIKIAGWITYASVVAHVFVAAWLFRRNARARPIAYQRETPQRSSPWYARSMGALGLVVLVFLAVHMKAFWYAYHFAALDLDVQGNRDLYGVVVSDFSRPGIVMFYVASMLALGFHVQHGLAAGLRSLGLYHPGAARLAVRGSAWLAWGICGAFAAMPLFIYLRGLG